MFDPHLCIIQVNLLAFTRIMSYISKHILSQQTFLAFKLIAVGLLVCLSVGLPFQLLVCLSFGLLVCLSISLTINQSTVC